MVPLRLKTAFEKEMLFYSAVNQTSYWTDLPNSQEQMQPILRSYLSSNRIIILILNIHKVQQTPYNHSPSLVIPDSQFPLLLDICDSCSHFRTTDHQDNSCGIAGQILLVSQIAPYSIYSGPVWALVKNIVARFGPWVGMGWVSLETLLCFQLDIQLLIHPNLTSHGRCPLALTFSWNDVCPNARSSFDLSVSTGRFHNTRDEDSHHTQKAVHPKWHLNPWIVNYFWPERYGTLSKVVLHYIGISVLLGTPPETVISQFASKVFSTNGPMHNVIHPLIANSPSFKPRPFFFDVNIYI